MFIVLVYKFQFQVISSGIIIWDVFHFPKIYLFGSQLRIVFVVFRFVLIISIIHQQCFESVELPIYALKSAFPHKTFYRTFFEKQTYLLDMFFQMMENLQF